jgi:hypothetical protein
VLSLSKPFAKVFCGCGNIITMEVVESIPEADPVATGKVKRFAKAVVKHAATGFKRTPDKVFEIRKAECAKCEHNNGRTCDKCGCQIVGWPNKLAWDSEACPVGKW